MTSSQVPEIWRPVKDATAKVKAGWSLTDANVRDLKGSQTEAELNTEERRLVGGAPGEIEHGVDAIAIKI